MRDRRPAQRRQVHAVQRADQGRHRGGELSVLHHRAQRRHRRGARPAPGGAGGDRQAAEACMPADRRVRRHRRAGRRRIEGRRPGQPVPRQHPRDRRHRRTWCAASTTTTWSTSRARSIRSSDIETINTELALADLATVEKHDRSATARWRKSAATRRRSSWSRCWRRSLPHLNEGKPARTLDARCRGSTRCCKPLCLLTMKPTMYVANVAGRRLQRQPAARPPARHTPRRKARRWSRSAPRSRREIADLDRRGQAGCSSPTWAWTSRAWTA